MPAESGHKRLQREKNGSGETRCSYRQIAKDGEEAINRRRVRERLPREPGGDPNLAQLGNERVGIREEGDVCRIAYVGHGGLQIEIKGEREAHTKKTADIEDKISYCERISRRS